MTLAHTRWKIKWATIAHLALFFIFIFFSTTFCYICQGSDILDRIYSFRSEDHPSSRQMGRKSKTERADQVDWNSFVQQPEPQVNNVLSESSRRYLGVVHSNFQRSLWSRVQLFGG